MTPGSRVTFALLSIAFVFAAIGVCVDTTTLGDREEYRDGSNAEALFHASKYRFLEQYDSILLQRKSERAQWLLPFSFVRNVNQLAALPRSLRTTIEYENEDKSLHPRYKVAAHLGVFDGLKGMSALLAAWGTTFFFSWSSIIGNYDDVE